MKPRIISEQKITPFANKYKLFVVDENGTKSELKALAQQKRFAFKEKVMFYADEAKNQPIFSFRAEKVLDIHGQYFVEDTEGDLLGSFKKQFKQSILKSTWVVMDAEGIERYVVTESSRFIALLRRFGGQIPIIGGVFEILALLLKYHFDIVVADGNRQVGSYIKITLFRDHYEMSLDDGAVNDIDERVWMAMAVGLDALQSR